MNNPTTSSVDIAELQFAPFNWVPFWCPRIWNGMTMHAWGTLMRENHYRFSPSRVPSGLIATCTTVLPTFGDWLQRNWYAEAIDDLPLVGDPIFVIGHWRTGTTWLHELVAENPDFAFPTTFHCFFPNSFLVTRSWLRPMTAFLIPPKRPMDDMSMGWDVPQEDEFALLSMGLPTPYRRIAFPNNFPRFMDYLNMNGIPARELQTWKDGMRGFIKNLNYAFRKPVILKSPPHTGRISILLEMFPQAKFVHITRHPDEFIPSTARMWASLDSYNGMQVPHHRELIDYVFSSFDRLYRGFKRDEQLLEKHNYFEVRYPDLVANPVAQMEAMYAQLQLGDFSSVRQKIIERHTPTRTPRAGKYAVSANLKQVIREKCGDYMARFGYED